YTAISKEGATIAFLDTAAKQKGWKTIFNRKNAWVQYNSVDFGSKKSRFVDLNTISATGGTVEIRLDRINGPLLCKVNVAKNSEWTTIYTALTQIPAGVHHLFAVNAEDKSVEIDFLSFK
ncbi:MAG: carbohydrate-binding protein, partial [Sphingobacteriaceae bacterium]